jgi:small subunit ribosomal protein S16
VLKIRLRRMGSRQDPYYRVVVSESTKTPGGDSVDTLGTYHPGTNPATIRIDVPRIEEWIRKGAHPSGTVSSLLEKARAARA